MNLTNLKHGQRFKFSGEEGYDDNRLPDTEYIFAWVKTSDTAGYDGMLDTKSGVVHRLPETPYEVALVDAGETDVERNPDGSVDPRTLSGDPASV